MLTRKQLEQLRREPLRGRNRLERAMEIADVTQVEVATAIDVTQAYVSKLARGEYTDLPLEKSRDLAAYFGCSIEDLFPARAAVAS